ncbi:SGNH/GDSL hydrolase family protein [Paenibacillus septentrionalis]|uniref:SGNH/GDSL hydrolase family protein n=1 Tax=Paenibacillus septentrionalis TaxID=429342 RepID=A0ABW1V0W1_9BACL
MLNKSLNIGVFGDSIGKGILLKPESNRYSTIKLDLHKLIGASQQQLSIQNYCMMGSTITKGLSILDRHMDKVKQFQTVFLEFGGNDCDYNWQQISEQPHTEHECNTPIPLFLKQYSEMINKIRARQGNPIMLTLPPLVPDKYFDWLSRNLNKDNILTWLGGDVNAIYRWQELYNAKVTSLAAKLSVPLIDIRSAFLTHPRYQQLMCEDGIHPNEAGYTLIYRTISKQYRHAMLSV